MQYGDMQENASLQDRFFVWLRECRSGEVTAFRRSRRPRPSEESCPECAQPMTRNHVFRRGAAFVFALALIAAPAASHAAGSVVISEIAAFEKSDHEWAEVVNRSAESVDVTGWKFFEDGTNHALTVFRGEGSVLAPGEYAVIADVAANFVADYPGYAGKIFDSSWTTLNENGELIGLRDASGTLVESFTYLPAPDSSLERTDLARDDYSAVNWAARPSGATPGAAYVATTTTDLADEAASLELAADTSSVSEPLAAPAVAPVIVLSAPPKPRVVISEFLPDPPGGDEGEWIEIANVGIPAVSLRGWQLSDGETSYIFDDRTLGPDQFIVVSRSATNIALDNGGDSLVLSDASGKEMSRAAYDDAEEGVSLARVEDGSYAPTTALTPGSGNQVVAPNRPPLLVLNAPREAGAGRLVLFDATDSVDPDGDAVTFHYEFDDGTEAFVPRTLHAFASGRRTISLTVTDVAGHEARKEVAIRVRGRIESVSVAAADDREPQKTAAAKKKTTTVMAKKSSRGGASKGPIVRGVVTAPPGALNRRTMMVVTGAGPVEVYQNDAQFPMLETGDELVVHGRKSSRKGLPRVLVDAADDIEVVGSAAQVETEVQSISRATAAPDGSLVTVRGEVVEIQGSDAVVSDEQGELSVGHPVGGWPEGFAVRATARVSGILRATARGKKLLPRGSDDVVVEKPPDPQAVAAATPAPAFPYKTALPVAGSLTALVLGTKEVRRRLQLMKVKRQNFKSHRDARGDSPTGSLTRAQRGASTGQGGGEAGPRADNFISNQELVHTYGAQTPTYRLSLNHADR